MSVSKRIALLGMILTGLLSAAAPAAASAAPSQAAFEKNIGQAGAAVEYFSRQGQGFVWLTAEGFHLAQPDEQGKMRELTMAVAGAKPGRWEGIGPTGGSISYHTSTDRSKWVDRAPRFASVRRNSVYPGIDLVFYYSGRKLEYDFIVHPGADPEQIRLRASSTGEPVKAQGTSLKALVGARQWTQLAPQLYQMRAGEKRAVEGGLYPCGENEFCFSARNWRRDLDLIVDPVLEFSSYLGGEGEDTLTAVGNGFVAGSTTSVALLGGAPARRRQRDIFIRFLNPNTGNLSTIPSYVDQTVVLGGSGDDDVSAGVYLSSTVSSAYSSSITIGLGGTTSSTDLFGSAEASQYGGGASDAFAMYVTFTLNANSNFSDPISVSGSYVGGSGKDIGQGLSIYGSSLVVVGTTDSTDLATVLPIQSSLGGGTDAFVAVVSLYTNPSLRFATYWGGSGDDSGLAVANSSNAETVLLAGETRSADFPTIPGTRRGLSDAYFVELKLAGLFGSGAVTPSFLNSSALGGDGEDRITGIVVGGGFTTFAGDTTSSDLATKDAYQSSPGGGVDGFIGSFRQGSYDLVRLSYIGGSGEDHMVALSQNAGGEVAFGGWTTSDALKTLDATQASLKGGQDGLFGVYSNIGQLRQLSYFGGSKEDKITGVYIQPSASVRLIGVTASPDLPVVKSWQAGLDDRLDSFVAEISAKVFDVPATTWVVNRYGSSVNVRSAANLVGMFLTVRIADPAVAGVATADGVVSEGTIVIPLFQGSYNVTLVGLAEAGETTATFSIPGYPTQTTRVRTGKAAYTINVPKKLDAFNTSIGLAFFLTLKNPEDDAEVISQFFALRAGNPTPQFSIENSDPSILKITPEPAPSTTFRLAGQKAGVVTLRVSSNYPLVAPDTFEIEVVKPEYYVNGNADMILSKDEVRSIPVLKRVYVQGALSNYSGAFRVESEDPSKLLVDVSDGSRPNNFQASAEITLSVGSGRVPFFQVKALSSSGTVRVRISSPAIAGDVWVTVQLRRIVATPRIVYAAFSQGKETPVLPPTARFGIAFSTRYEGENVDLYYNPAQQVTITSSNLGVCDPGGKSYPVSNNGAGALMTLSEGTTELSFQFNIANVVGEKLRFQVSTNAPSYTSPVTVVVGKNLVAAVDLRPPFLNAGSARISVDDPAVVLLKNPAGNDGLSNITVATVADGSISFPVIGLADKGSTNIRIQIANRQEIVVPVRAAPSGFAFTNASLTRSFYADASNSIRVTSFILDEGTLIPLTAQSIRPGQPVRVELNPDPEFLSLSTSVCNLLNSGTYCIATPKFLRTGSSKISITPVDGFTVPSRLGQLVVEARAAVASLQFNAGVRDALVGATLFVDGSPGTPVTITSLDPTKALLSDNAAVAGQPSIVAKHGTFIYLHGYSAEGTATLRLTGSQIEQTEVTLLMRPLRLGVSTSYASAPNATIEVLRNTPASGSAYLISPEGVGTSGLRPGLAPIPLRVLNSNPGAIRLSSDVAAFGVGTGRIDFQIEAVGDGEAELNFEAGGAGSAIPRVGPLTVRSRRAELRLGPSTLAKSFLGVYQVGLERGARGPTDNSFLTVRSLDPSRLLLSRTPTLPGASSIQVIWPVGAMIGESFYAYALASEGTVDIEFSMADYITGRATVYLGSAYFSFANDTVNPLTIGVDSGRNIAVAQTPRPDLGSIEGLGPAGYSLQTGLPPIAVPIEVSNPGVVDFEAITDYVAARGFLKIRPLKPGTTTLRLGVPPGFAAPPSGPSELTLTVLAPSLPTLRVSGNVPYESVAYGTVFEAKGIPLTLRSSNPAALLIAPDLKSAPQATLLIPASGDFPAFYLHGLGKSGVVALTLSAPGFADTIVNVTLLASGFMLSDAGYNPNPAPLAIGQKRTVAVSFVTLDSDGRSTGGISSGLRPGAVPARVQITSTNPSVLRVTPDTVTFQPGEFSKEITLEGLAAGSTILEATTPAGFTAPSTRAVLYKVIVP